MSEQRAPAAAAATTTTTKTTTTTTTAHARQGRKIEGERVDLQPGLERGLGGGFFHAPRALPLLGKQPAPIG